MVLITTRKIDTLKITTITSDFKNANEKMQTLLNREDVSVVHNALFYDRIDEKHKAIICYYE